MERSWLDHSQMKFFIGERLRPDLIKEL